MRILLDECVPIQIRAALHEHDVASVHWLGWGGYRNGALLDAADQAGFDLLIVADKNLRYQQMLATRRMAILELWTNHRPTLERHFGRIRAAVESIQPGQYHTLTSESS